MPHLHGMHQLLLCVKHELDAAVCASPQLLDDKVLVDKHIALQDVRRQQHALRVSSAQQCRLCTVLTSDVTPASGRTCRLSTTSRGVSLKSSDRRVVVLTGSRAGVYGMP